VDRDVLLDLIRKGPVEIKMNNGEAYLVPSPEFALVDSLHAHVMYWDDERDQYRTKILSLLAVCSAEHVELAG